MRHASLDESGNVGPAVSSEYFLVVSLMTADEAALRLLERRVKRFLKKEIQKKAALAGEELKASRATSRQVESLLGEIAKEAISIVAVIVDKRGGPRGSENAEEVDREAVATAVRLCATHWPRFQLTLDKRYTNRKLIDLLDERIGLALKAVPDAEVTPRHMDSRLSIGLQTVDFVAWAIKRKYESGETRYYDLIRERIVVEEVIRAK